MRGFKLVPPPDGNGPRIIEHNLKLVPQAVCRETSNHGLLGVPASSSATQRAAAVAGYLQAETVLGEGVFFDDANCSTTSCPAAHQCLAQAAESK